MFIYKITNLINNKVYIGQTINPVKIRFCQHIKNKDSLIGKAIKKYRKENFKIEILNEYFTLNELNYFEEYYIEQENSLAPNGYNLLIGGENRKTHKNTKIKVRKSILIKHKNNKNYYGVAKETNKNRFKSKICIDNKLHYIYTSKSEKWCAYKYDQYCIDNNIDTMLNNITYKEAYKDYLKYYDLENKPLSIKTKNKLIYFNGTKNIYGIVYKKQYKNIYIGSSVNLQKAIEIRNEYIKNNDLKQYFNLLNE